MLSVQHLINIIIAKLMRSLIKMEVSKYPVFDVLPMNQLPYNEQQSRYNGAATHHSMRSSFRKNPIYNINNSNKIESCGDNPSQLQNKKKQSERKKSIQKYISDLTTDIENPFNEPDLGQTKFKVLKRIIQHYDIKNMQKNHYSKLIKTFGLKIQPARTQRKQVKSHNQDRSFKIKSSAKESDRVSRLRNRLQGHGDGEVALLQISRQLKPIPKESYMRKKSFTSQNFMYKCKQKFRVNKDKKNKDANFGKKVSPFKFKSMQDNVVQKINKYREFLFILNYSNHLYRKMDIQIYQIPLKFYVGPGNNGNLIKSLMKKRFYFQETPKIKQANFIWTQIKIDDIFNSQKKSIHNISQNNKKIQKKEIRIKLISNIQLQESLQKILTKSELNIVLKHTDDWSRKINTLSFQQKAKLFERKINMMPIQITDRIHNHLPCNGLLGNKKGMLYCLRQYYKVRGRNVWDILPLTFHICKGVLDNDFKQFSSYYNERKKNKLPNVWIMKPGQFSNRGNGITCSNKIEQIRKRASKCNLGRNGQAKTLILQLYISNPLLYNGRKFDIRVYMLVTCHNGKMKGYWYQQGYIRTSSYPFDLNQLTDNDIHLTNDAIQKKSQKYGKFQPGNKLSYAQLQRYLDTLSPNGRNLDFYQNALPKMREIASDALMSSFMFLDENKRENNFQIFGLDFMLDFYLKPWLIQINTNPCLQLSCPLLQRIIPHMVQNAFRIGLDTIFPPPNFIPNNYKYNISENALHYNKFQLVFDEDRDGPYVHNLYETYPGSSTFLSSLTGIQQDQQIFHEEGVLCDYDI